MYKYELPIPNIYTCVYMIHHGYARHFSCYIHEYHMSYILTYFYYLPYSGSDDAIVTPADTADAAALLNEAGYPVDMRTIKHLGHSIDQEVCVCVVVCACLYVCLCLCLLVLCDCVYRHICVNMNPCM